ncbi:MAG: aconitate hydratase AcnA [Candidatus Hinthialibacter antarcticus]|nr:aconitate hydratase AcnA [Candidatus Hinthialibacter antarcticus]
MSLDHFKCKKTLDVNGTSYDYFSLPAASQNGLGDISRLPYTLKVLLENMLRFEDDRTVTAADAQAVADWLKEKKSSHEIAYRPARVLMQDFTGVPAVVDLAAMRDAMKDLGGDPQKINPLTPVDLVIDHSVMVDQFATAGAFQHNVEMEYKRNIERYEFLRWGQTAFNNFRVVPPGAGICHQVNLENLAQVVWTADTDGNPIAYPDTLVGTDSHTTMINGLAVLGWGVGGIEAEAAMLGQPVSMLIPEVVGFRLKGTMPEGATATDLVLTVTQMLRAKGVVGKFVEYFGPGLDNLPLADRATLANMSPEYGATCGFFPIDKETITYLELTSRDPERIALVEAYAKAQGMWRDSNNEPEFTDTLELDMGEVKPSMAGPKRPQDKVYLSDADANYNEALKGFGGDPAAPKSVAVEASDYKLTDGDVVIAAITSCTNTSNPSVMIAAGLVARNAAQKGLKVKPWVKTSLAPGSKVVTDYLNESGLQDDLDSMGFNLVGYGCTTCIGNSGPLPEPIAKAIVDGDLTVAAVLSGNRNFEGRVNPHTKANYLASPPLVVAYALAGSMRVNLTTEPLGEGADGQPVYLKDIWPTTKEIQETVLKSVKKEQFATQYGAIFEGDEAWQNIEVSGGQTYEWQADSTYVKLPPYFVNMPKTPEAVTDIQGARVLALLADSVTTDHISPAGAIKTDGPTGAYLQERNITPAEFNSYGSRRGNHEVMMRGTFANIRLRNEMVEVAGGYTKYIPGGEEMSIYDAAMKYMETDTPLVVVAGKEYGTGSSRDWAAKGTRLLGVRAVIAESFERIHRSNLIGMGVMPLQFKDGQDRNTLKLDGSETFDIAGIASGLKPRMDIACTITRADGSKEEVKLLCRIDTLDEIVYYQNSGILHYVLRNLAS